MLLFISMSAYDGHGLCITCFIDWFDLGYVDSYTSLNLLCSAPDNLHRGSSRWCERERASEPLKMVARLRGISGELQGREAHGFCSLLHCTVCIGCQRCPSGLFYLFTLILAPFLSLWWFMLFLACSIWCLMRSPSLCYMQRWPRRISLLKEVSLNFNDHLTEACLIHEDPTYFLWYYHQIIFNLWNPSVVILLGIVGDSNAYDQSKRLRTGGGDCTHSVYSPSPFHPPPPQVWGPPHGWGILFFFIYI